jgi:hypothetical protein
MLQAWIAARKNISGRNRSAIADDERATDRALEPAKAIPRGNSAQMLPTPGASGHFIQVLTFDE